MPGVLYTLDLFPWTGDGDWLKLMVLTELGFIFIPDVRHKTSISSFFFTKNEAIEFVQHKCQFNNTLLQNFELSSNKLIFCFEFQSEWM
jgi:hypothetical protein